MTIEVPSAISTRNGHARCVVCGSLNPRSLKLAFQPAGKGAVTAWFQASPELQGYAGMLHGGIIASLMDAAMTHCLFFQKIQAVTGDLHVRFLQPVPCEISLEIFARILSSRPPVYRLRAEIGLDGQIVAWAEAKFMQRQLHHS